MKPHRIFIILILFLITKHKINAQYQTFSLSWNTNAYEKYIYKNSSNDSMPYRLLKPNNNDPNKSYPLVVMLHGTGEGIGTDCTIKNGVNICNLGWGGKMHLDSLNKYPAFYLFPQTSQGSWFSSFATGNYPDTPPKSIKVLTELLDLLLSKYNIDKNRIYGHGLCAGALGIYEVATRYPHLFAAISPMQAAGNSNNYTPFLNIPMWGTQGESDLDPSLPFGLALYKQLEKNGRPLLYTLDQTKLIQNWPNPAATQQKNIFTIIPYGGHQSWPNLYNSPTWLNWMFSQNKLNITVYGKTNIYSDESVKLEMAAGFDAYEWSTGATTRSIIVTQPGSYKVRVKRKATIFNGTSDFTEWSPVVVVTQIPGVKDLIMPTSPTNITCTGKTSTSIDFTWNSSTDNVGVDHYQIYMNNVKIDSTKNTFYTAKNLLPGKGYDFRLVAVDIQGNSSFHTYTVNYTTNNTAYGLTYYSYHGNWTTLPDFNTQTLVATGLVNNFSLSPKLRDDYFGFKYDGFIDIPVAGNYTFYTSSDDGSKLFIDSVLIVNNDGIHGVIEKSGIVNLTKGKHFIRVTYFDNTGTGEALQVKFDGPGITKRLIPDTSLYYSNTLDNIIPSNPSNLISTGKTTSTIDLSWNPSTDNYAIAGYQIFVNGIFKQFSLSNTATVTDLNPNTLYQLSIKTKDASGNLSDFSNTVEVNTDAMLNGVKYSYYEGSFTTLPNFASLIPVKNGYITNFSLSPRLHDDYFSFKFESFIQISTAGTYTFYTSSNDGSKLYINGTQVVNNDGMHGSVEKSGSINLPVGKHAILVTYFESVGGEDLTVNYSGPSIAKQPIPTNVLFINNNPVITALTNKSMNERDSLIIPIFASDVDGDNISLSIQNLPSFATFSNNNNGTGQINFKPGKTGSGIYTIIVNASDSRGGSDSKSFTLTVVDVVLPNNNPIITAIADKTMKEGLSQQVAVIATDADGDSINFSVQNLPSFGYFTKLSGSGQITFNPGFSDAGIYTITVNANDGYGGTDSKSFILTVTDSIKININPVITAVPDKTMTEGTSLSVPISATDADKDSIRLSVQNLPSFGTFNSTNGSGQINFNPGLSDAGTYNIKIKANDGKGGKDSTAFILTVADFVPVNNNPVITLINDKAVTVGTSLAVPVSATDADGDSISLSVVNLPSFGSFTSTNGSGQITFNPGATDIGTYNITVNAIDKKSGTDSKSFILTISNIPSMINGVNYTYYEGSYNALPDFTTLTPLKTGTTNTFNLTPRLHDDNFAFKFESNVQINTPGVYTFYTSSNDGSKLYIDGTQIVNNDGQHAEIEKSGTVNLTTGKHAIIVTFFEKINAEVLNVRYSGPSIPKQIIPSEVLFINSGNTTPNKNPIITSITNQLMNTGTSLEVPISATDADGDNINLSIPILPIFGSLSNTNGNGKITFNPGANDAGTYNITVNANDGKGGTDSKTFTLIVATSASASANGVNYSYYEGAFTTIPNYNSLSSVKTGTVPNFALTPKNNTDKYSFRFTSYIQINTAGNYTFYTSSNDGTKLLIDGVLIVNNDGLHAAQERSGSINLSVGKHAIEVGYIQNGGGEILTISYAGPGILKQAIPDDKLFLTNSAAKTTMLQSTDNDSEELKKETESAPILSAYPNPFYNQISITINSQNEGGLLKVYNSVGNLIMQRNIESGEHNLDLTHFPEGLYFLKIYNANEKEIQNLRIVKK